MSKIKIVVVDDHPMVRQVLRHSLEQEADFAVVGEAADGDEAVRLTDEFLPQLVLMDIKMPGVSGVEATRQIIARHSGVAVLGLTAYDEDEHVLGILQAGAVGYLLKTASRETLIQALRSVLAGVTVLDPQVYRKLLKRAVRRQPATTAPGTAEPLGARELDVLRLAAGGMRNEVIASRLGISVRTVKGHFEEIYAKMRVQSRTEAAMQALKRGHIRIEDIEFE